MTNQSQSIRGIDQLCINMSGSLKLSFFIIKLLYFTQTGVLPLDFRLSFVLSAVFPFRKKIPPV